MYALTSTQSKAVCAVRRSAKVCAPMRTGYTGVRSVVVRAEEKTAEVDYSVQAQEALTKGAAYAKTVWDDTADAEKPAIIGIILAAVIGQIAIGATMDKIDKLPFFGDLFEIIGLAVAAAYIYRYVTDPAERVSAKATVDGVIAQITGKE